MADSKNEVAGAEFRAEVDERLLHAVAAEPATANTKEIYKALAIAAREQLASRWVNTQVEDRRKKTRRIYYMSMEFLIGRTLDNALSALGLHEKAAAAFADAGGPSLTEVIECEPDAALGNGGLGRLAACFLDSMATLELPSWGYGMRYEYGMFAQSIVNGGQVEHPDSWLVDGTPWEFPRPGTVFPVRFGGTAEHHGEWAEWNAAEAVEARAFDYVIPGHGTGRVSTLRLWKAGAPAQIDLNAFNSGDYARAAEFKNRFENISWVLYPNDSTPAGRELRLRQEYFFVSASLQDIIFHHLEEHSHLNNLADQIAIHLNDTHPAIAVAELMRLLCDEYGMLWTAAWQQCQRIFSYTNHTLMPEALETWPVSLIQSLLPRHMRIIYRINQDFLAEVERRFPGDIDLIRSVSLIDEGDGSEENKRVRMAHLSIVGSHRVNGVSQLHSDLMVKTIFAGFAKLYPQRFHNKTNGVTPRRWLQQCNPGLTAVIRDAIGDGFLDDAEKLADLNALAGDAALGERVAEVKRSNKVKLAAHLKELTGVRLNPDALFDVQIKRIHEYKRQLLNLIETVALYDQIRSHPEKDWVPRVKILGGKAAPSYSNAKLIIKLANDIARRINADPSVGGLLKVVFVPNYNVTLAERIIPAADLSEQISTAGMEASGTGNMKFALNGALTIGTLDGANIEIKDRVGDDNIFIFGLTADEVLEKRNNGYDPRKTIDGSSELQQAMAAIASGVFSHDDPKRYVDLMGGIYDHDWFMIAADFDSYTAAQRAVDQVWETPATWQAMAIRNIANVGWFSSDRTIGEYARDIWGVK